MNDLKTMAIEKLNELIVKEIPEENRDEEKLDHIKEFAKYCFFAGFKLGCFFVKKEQEIAVN